MSALALGVRNLAKNHVTMRPWQNCPPLERKKGGTGYAFTICLGGIHIVSNQ